MKDRPSLGILKAGLLRDWENKSSTEKNRINSLQALGRIFKMMLEVNNEFLLTVCEAMTCGTIVEDECGPPRDGYECGDLTLDLGHEVVEDFSGADRPAPGLTKQSQHGDKC